MKKLLFLLLLPIISFAQERQIGTYSGTTYSFYWNMKTVVQHAMPNQTIDSVFVNSPGRMNIIFKDSGTTYTDVFLFTASNGGLFTSASSGCMNSCKKVDCSMCDKYTDCSCGCSIGYWCESKNLGIFININVSNGIRNHILTHQNP